MKALILVISCFVFLNSLFAEETKVSPQNSLSIEEEPSPIKVPDVGQLKRLYNVDEWPVFKIFDQPNLFYQESLSINYNRYNETGDKLIKEKGYVEIRFRELIKPNKTVFSVYQTSVFEGDKPVCKLMVPKSKVKTKKWFECVNRKCVPKESPTEVELIVPRLEEYGYYHVSSTDDNLKPCPYELFVRSGKKFLLYFSKKHSQEDWERYRAANVVPISGIRYMIHSVLSNGQGGEVDHADTEHYGSPYNNSYRNSDWAGVVRRPARVWSVWEFDFKVEFLKKYIFPNWDECSKDQGKSCIQKYPWFKKLVCENEKCLDQKKLDHLLTEIRECFATKIPGTDFPAGVTSKGKRCKIVIDEDSNSLSVEGVDYPEAFWDGEELDFYPEVYNQKNPIIIVPSES